MEPVILMSSRRYFLVALAGGMGLIAAVILFPPNGNLTLFDWSAIVFFSLGASVCMREVSTARPRLIIEEDGITDRMLGAGKIRWADVERVYVRPSLGILFLCVVVRNPETYMRRLSPLRRVVSLPNRALGFADFSIGLAGIAARTDEVMGLVMGLVNTSSAADQRHAADGECRRETGDGARRAVAGRA